MSSKIVFLDIDGTLLNTGGAGQAAMERTLVEEFQITVPFEGVLTAGRTDRGITEEVFTKYGFESTPESRIRFRDAYLARLPETLKDAPGHLYAGVTELVEGFSMASNVDLGLLTGNYEEAAWIKVGHYSLDHHFHFGGFGDDDALRDDVARNALKAAAKHVGRELTGAESVVVGDTPADVQCARAIGAYAVAVATGSYSAEALRASDPDLLFEDFSDSAAVVESILGLID